MSRSPDTMVHSKFVVAPIVGESLASEFTGITSVPRLHSKSSVSTRKSEHSSTKFGASRFQPSGWLSVSLLAMLLSGWSSAAEVSRNSATANVDRSIRTYALSQIDQFRPAATADILPESSDARSSYARSIALDAAIYGMPGALQYREMYKQAIDRSSPTYVGFNQFVHERQLAGPGYKAFKTPNSDTLYSNAWLDLTAGPVIVDIPDVPLKYYTLEFLDMYSNASNIGTRTFGNKAGRYLIAPAGWDGAIPDGVTLFTVATPQMWVLMRVFAQHPAEVEAARLVQDSVKIMPTETSSQKHVFPPPDIETPVGFYSVIDYVLRTNGHPDQEDALIHRFQAIGIGGPKGFDPTALDRSTKSGIDAGFADAMEIIAASHSQLGSPTGSGWKRTTKARYQFNYLSRAVTNFVGLGANVEEENLSFNTFVDRDGRPLDGSSGHYALDLKPPPARAFWSVTVYDGSNFELHPNRLNRYSVSDRTPGLYMKPDGSVPIAFQHEQPIGATNWLPTPEGPFYVVVRSYLPTLDMLSGGWLPDPIVKVQEVKQ